MTRCLTIPLMTLGLTLMSPPAQAQSMYVEGIVDEVVGQVCAPLMQAGDVAAAIAAAQALRYAHTEDSVVRLDEDLPWARAILYRGHRGTVTISQDYGRIICSVGIAEGTVTQINDRAVPLLSDLGMTQVLDQRGETGAEIMVWTGPRFVAFIHPSPVYQPGSELTFSAAAR